MKFGINLSSALPRPWRQGDEHRMIIDCVNTARLADELGFDYFWIGEHHFLEQYHHISAPETLMGALAMVTQRIRLAHGIMTLQPRMNHPVRVAERIALEDHLSNGRIDFGSGRGSGMKEWQGFGIDEKDTKEAWLESLRAVLAMWKTEEFSWDGTHFQIPACNVIPKPLQSPHPPLWLACTNPETQRVAGEMGMGSIAFLYAGLEDVAERVQIYREGLKSPKNRVGDFTNDCFAFFANCVVDQDEARAKQLYLESSEIQRAAFTTHGWTAINGTTLSADVKRHIAERRSGVDWEDVLERGGSVVGTPDQAIDTLRRYARIGIDMTVFNVFPGISGFAEIERNLRTVADHVIPRFRERFSRAVTSPQIDQHAGHG
jgi:alkanesulfonate monooxygenase SsuD/methylene tetrahydromethanopterin reductase-like flavin-dependent oxidoreductase (luciferase family)